MILSGQTIRRLGILDPLVERAEHRSETYGIMTYGLGPAGYDVRMELRQGITYARILPGGFLLASTMERFRMPHDVLGIVHDKSSWARRGITMQNTVIEPGWEGYLTLEITNHSRDEHVLVRGYPIAQIVFHRLDEPTEAPYAGKYQNQARGPQTAL